MRRAAVVRISILIAAAVCVASCAARSDSKLHELAAATHSAFGMYRQYAEAPVGPGVESSDVRESEAFSALGQRIDEALAEMEISTETQEASVDSTEAGLGAYVEDTQGLVDADR